MAFTPEDKAAEILEQVIAQINEKFPTQQAQQIETFVQHFYHYVAADDVLERGSISDLYGAAVDYWHFARQFMPCQTQDSISAPKVRIYNPQFERDGWQSPHTVISILTRDMPFLVDSIRMTVNKLGLTVHLIIHPVVYVRRDAEGNMLDIMPPHYVDVDSHSSEPPTGEFANYETLIHVEIDHQTEASFLDNVKAELEAVLRDVRLAVMDWQPLRERLQNIINSLEQTPPPLETEEVDEARAFLKWLCADHFTFLGFREYAVEDEGEEQVLRIVPNSSLGILRKVESPISRSFAELPAHLKQVALQPELLLLTKTNTRSTVHRPVYMDYIGIKIIDADCKVVGEWRFLGLYTSAAYHMTTLEIPLLRRKVNYVLENAGYRHHSHQSKALFNILESYPRDEIFQIDINALYRNVLGILQLQERQRVRLFVRPDPFGRFIACIVYAPRDHYDTEVRKRMQAVLLQAFDGDSIEFNVQLTESVLAQVYFIVHTPAPELPTYDERQIEARLIEVTREWSDKLYDALLEQRGEEQGTYLFRHYQEAFPVAYCADFNARHAVFDIDKLESLDSSDGLAMSLYRPLEALDHSLRFKLFHRHDHIPLSQILPMLENMGVQVISERAYQIKPTHQHQQWIQEFELRHTESGELDMGRLNSAFQAVFARVWRGELDNDGFNRLVLRAGLEWHDIVVFRAYCRYLRQTGRSLSQIYMQNTLANNPQIVAKLLALFHARCNPAREDAKQAEKLQAELEALLDSVASLDEDRILRQFLSVMRATLRTNYFQTDAQGQPKAYVSFKFDPQQIPDLPEPRPMFEIFVYSPRIEGVHLRGGKVARGGLRWSDRYEDFRTEVLGLVKAQMVKNAVIVPVGSKGGFVAKQLPTEQGRDAIQAEGIECYKTFIRGLLDVTDNLQEGEIVPPPQVVRHDEDDPYLVVAADKGTATFSDIANEIAQSYNFWLGDAFASGGSAGYDHKKMGITARGAWESVKRHFRELGLNTQSESFTVVGIGDMSGDVFGNGMLLSPHIKLIGAFNHLHIFIDPDPDPHSSFAERQRLFNLPRSSWMDYDKELISAGGGVFSRKSKSIMLTPEMRRVLGVNHYTLSPTALISALLQAPVDLLWNGGIGTYVKAATEHHSDVGDRANDGLRVDGQSLNCRVVGEGGNLGFTQLGRIEYARNGGRINTDAIDNVGGVDCSDHEVNIKILLNAIVSNGDMTDKQRNQLLAEMTDGVAHLVIRNNYLQTQALSISTSIAGHLLSAHTRLMHQLEREERLDRALEFLPNDKALAERSAEGSGLSAPEISVLLAYSKITLYDNLLASEVPEDPYLDRILFSYFPAPLPSRFADEIHAHRLRREIIATDLTNMVVNRAGSTFIYMLGEETGQSPANITRAFIAAWDIYDIGSVWAAIEALDNQISAQTQMHMMMEARKLVERAARWLLRNRKMPLDIAETVDNFHPGVMQLRDKLLDLVSDTEQAHLQSSSENWIAQDVPAELATQVTYLVTWLSALDIVDVAKATERPLEVAAGVHFLLGTRLKLHWLRDHISALPRDDRWKALSRFTLREELYSTHRELTHAIMQMCVEATDPTAHFETWLQEKEACVSRCQDVLSELSSIDKPDLSMLSVAVREMRNLL